MLEQIRRLLNKLIGAVLNEELKMKLQKIFRIYICKIYIIEGMNEFKMVKPRIKCGFIPITFDNYHRVEEFREKGRISQYRDKLANNEIGYFAEYDGKMIGSIWATINKTEGPYVAKTFFKLMPNEGLLHDNVISEKIRRMRVGAFLESRMTALLFKEYGLSRMITDVNVRNHASLGMLETVGFRIDSTMLFVSAFGKLLLQKVLTKHT